MLVHQRVPQSQGFSTSLPVGFNGDNRVTQSVSQESREETWRKDSQFSRQAGLVMECVYLVFVYRLESNVISYNVQVGID